MRNFLITIIAILAFAVPSFAQVTVEYDSNNDAVDSISVKIDSDDYIVFDAASNVPSILTTGSCNLKIDADGGTVDLSDNAMTTTGGLTANGAASLGTTAGVDSGIGNNTGAVTITTDDATFTLTDATDNVFQLVNSGGAVVFDVDLGEADAITAGSGAETFTINSSDWDISATGDMSGIGSISANGAFTGTLGATLSGADCDFNKNSNFNVNINTGTSTGITQIGNSLSTISIAGIILGATPLVFEGNTANDYELTLAVADVTADRTATMPDYTGSIPLVVSQSSAQTTVTGATPTDVTGSSLTLANGWFSAGKTLRWTVYGTASGNNAVFTCTLFIDDGDIVTLTSPGNANGDWSATFTLHEHTAYATQDAMGTMWQTGGTVFTAYDTDTTDFNDGGTTDVKVRITPGNAGDTVTVEHVVVEHFVK